MSRISRRDFIKYTGVSVSALSCSSLFYACGGSGSSSLSCEPIQRTVHLGLDSEGFLSADENYILHVAGKRYPLISHTDESRIITKASPVASHYVPEVTLPGDRVIHMYVTQRSDGDGRISEVHGSEVDHGLALNMIHIPDGAQILSGSTALETQRFFRAEENSLPTFSSSTLDSFTPADIAVT